MHVSPVLRP
jgi:hypothetical protein